MIVEHKAIAAPVSYASRICVQPVPTIPSAAQESYASPACAKTETVAPAAHAKTVKFVATTRALPAPSTKNVRKGIYVCKESAPRPTVEPLPSVPVGWFAS